jgi:hypothetical protein
VTLSGQTNRSANRCLASISFRCRVDYINQVYRLKPHRAGLETLSADRLEAQKRQKRGAARPLYLLRSIRDTSEALLSPPISSESERGLEADFYASFFGDANPFSSPERLFGHLWPSTTNRAAVGHEEGISASVARKKHCRSLALSVTVKGQEDPQSAWRRTSRRIAWIRKVFLNLTSHTTQANA